jgi:hypothetical protein
MTDRIFRFVLNEQVGAWEGLGWKAHAEALSGTHHGDYSTLMEWVGKGHPIEPDRAEPAFNAHG